MLFYYSATGNSLYVAKNLEDHLVSIPQALKDDHLVFEDDTIGIVTPVYAGELPKTVRRFIEKATLKSSYIYIISTYGKADSVASLWATNFAKENGIQVHYANSILMVDNYLPSFDMNEERSIDKKVEEQLAIIKADIKERKEDIKQPTQADIDLYNGASQRFKENPHLVNGESLFISDKCSGCGLCVQVCPIGNLEVRDGKVVRKEKTCDFCLACVHACPSKGVQLQFADKNPDARYRHEKITLQEIIKSNKQ